MRADQLQSLAADLWDFVFGQLDAEPDWTGMDAGRVAFVVERAFEAAVRTIDPEPVSPSGAALFCEFCGAGPECIVFGRGRS